MDGVVICMLGWRFISFADPRYTTEREKTLMILWLWEARDCIGAIEHASQ